MMNQNELAELLNLQRQTVSAYERGITTPNIYVLIALADIFGVSIDELVGHKPTAAGSSLLPPGSRFAEKK